MSLSLLNVFTAVAALAVVKLTPDRHLSPQPPSVAERDLVSATASLPAADSSSARVPNASTLAGRLSGLIGGPGAKINAVVIDAVTRRPLFEQRADRPATPASTTKLATTVATLAALGPGHRITTQVVRGAGGGIVLVGGGDPTLTALPARPGATHPPYASLTDLARQTAASLKAAGVQRARVDYDASAYQGPRVAAGWKPNYLPDGEVAPVSALTLDEGRVAPGDPTQKSRVADPPSSAAAAFARLLTRNGVYAKRGRRVAAPQGAARLGAVQSPPVSALIEHLMTESDNDVAEAMARQVAIKLGRPASFADAAQAVRQVLAGLGAAEGVQVNDGSGLSPLNRITPLALARLASLAASPDHPELRSVITGLPVAGFSGTLRPPRYTVAASQAGAGTVRAKTGTLAGVSTLAGVAYDADGRLLAFAFMAGDGKSPVDPGKLDRLAATVASCGCG
ncbi:MULTISPECIES: D-alanyl-D-alanine carboxypeptidase/D-alanyl-D-alanine endopeptidase [Thermomonosporaceae]|uniref:D-alanyl-D-alanine carboxypeptidase/D-alanyl-D-alanine endopeptidase n=1 Tax=Thermomonosporaceae TaxID=2012 RepID=UPI00255AB99C|nr:MULTISPECIES: D-alanyl-D-alanine carboxypeptidase/D-alanyl-D-alanine-endopeptidase [Thermomonosporaceae]MDL4774001.1 D-alanyl-D-alanine carboxypeptidase/D-alanyl-D-alanine-endopeptidase [Actinomadura xylanilytica]